MGGNKHIQYFDPTGDGWFSKLWKKVKKSLTYIVVAAVMIATFGHCPYTQPSWMSWMNQLKLRALAKMKNLKGLSK